MCLIETIKNYENNNPKHKAKYSVEFPSTVSEILYAEKSLYLIKSESGKTKIGISIDVKRRLRQIKLSGYNAKIVATFTPEPTFDLDARYLEKILHSFFSKKRVFGEWFNLEKADILEIIYALDGIIDFYGNIDKHYI